MSVLFVAIMILSVSPYITCSTGVKTAQVVSQSSSCRYYQATHQQRSRPVSTPPPITALRERAHLQIQGALHQVNSALQNLTALARDELGEWLGIEA